MPPGTKQAVIDEWFDAIDCDDEELVSSMLHGDPSLLKETFTGAKYEEDIAELASELLGKTVGPLTPIQYACFVESEDAALILADSYSDEQLNQKWGDQNTLLHLIAFNGMERLLRKLLKRGLPPNIKNKHGFRPMDCVANDDTRDVFANFRDEENANQSQFFSSSSRCFQGTDFFPRYFLCLALIPSMESKPKVSPSPRFVRP